MKLKAAVVLLSLICVPALGDVMGKFAFQRRLMAVLQNAKRPLPEPLLDRLSRAVDYALTAGAAKEVGELDLYHAHVLYWPGAGQSQLSEPDGILVHTQELVFWDDGSHDKRNILLLGDDLKSLDCSLGQERRHLASIPERFCTVTPGDIGMKDPSYLFILKVDGMDQAELVDFRPNIRRIQGQSILFLPGYGFAIKDGQLSVPISH